MFSDAIQGRNETPGWNVVSPVGYSLKFSPRIFLLSYFFITSSVGFHFKMVIICINNWTFYFVISKAVSDVIFVKINFLQHNLSHTHTSIIIIPYGRAEEAMQFRFERWNWSRMFCRKSSIPIYRTNIFKQQFIL